MEVEWCFDDPNDRPEPIVMATIPCLFAIEMVVHLDGEAFSIAGDERHLILDFASLRSVARVVRIARTSSWPRLGIVQSLQQCAAIEIKVAGRKVACSGSQTFSDPVASILGFRSTRLYWINLLLSVFTNQRRHSG